MVLVVPLREESYSDVTLFLCPAASRGLRKFSVKAFAFNYINTFYFH